MRGEETGTKSSCYCDVAVAGAFRTSRHSRLFGNAAFALISRRRRRSTRGCGVGDEDGEDDGVRSARSDVLSEIH